MKRSDPVSLRTRIRLGACALLVAFAAHAQQPPVRDFDVAAGDLKTALDAYLAQAGVQLIYKASDISGVSTNGVKGSLSPEAALTKLLEGTRLTLRRGADGAMVIVAPAARQSSDDAVREMDSVMITASRRREPAREVPMKVEAISSDKLLESGAKTMTEYINAQPGVDIKSLGSPGLATISIRGVATGNSTGSSVGMYVDDVAVSGTSPIGGSGSAALDLSLLDLDHIEVLRGPQGTLYGAGAMGGLLKYVTKVPDTYELSGKVSFGASKTSNGGVGTTAAAVVNVPLKEDVAAMRFSAYVDRAGGVVDTVGAYQQEDADRGQTSAARVSFLLTPNKNLTVRLSALTQTIKRDMSSYVDYDATTRQPQIGDLRRAATISEPYKDKRDLLSADIEYDFGWARLNSITSTLRAESLQRADASAIYVPLLAGFGIPADNVPVDAGIELRKTTQELRLTSKPGAFEWLAGLYYSRENARTTGLMGWGLPNGQYGPPLLTQDQPSHYREVAVYADGTWKITPKLSVTGGVRFAHNSQTFSSALTGPLNGGDTFGDGSSSDSSTTYLATAQYALSPTSNVYTRIASGYRAGGPNLRAVDLNTGQPLGPASVAPDTLWSYELGYKADLLDKTLTIDAAIYDIEWKDIQQAASVQGNPYLINGGKARIRGLEAAANWRATPSLTLTGSVSFIDARLTEGVPAIGLADGARLPNSARASAAFGVDYKFQLAGYPANAGVSQRLVGHRNSGFEGSASIPNYSLAGYGMTDFQAGAKIGRVDLSFYLRNAFDRRAQLSALSNFVAFGGPALVIVSQPRTAGFMASVNF